MIDSELRALIQTVVDSASPDSAVGKVAIAALDDYASLHQRLMMDGGEPFYTDCCEYSDTLVNSEGEPRFGNLSRLEWMLRVVVGRCRRQKLYIEKLEARHTCKDAPEVESAH